MPRAQVIDEAGPPEVMQGQAWPVPDPAPGEVGLRHMAIGVNFADSYHRRGVFHPWPVPPYPVEMPVTRKYLESEGHLQEVPGICRGEVAGVFLPISQSR